MASLRSPFLAAIAVANPKLAAVTESERQQSAFINKLKRDWCEI
jgi:hypothetical protein